MILTRRTRHSRAIRYCTVGHHLAQELRQAGSAWMFATGCAVLFLMGLLNALFVFDAASKFAKFVGPQREGTGARVGMEVEEQAAEEDGAKGQVEWRRSLPQGSQCVLQGNSCVLQSSPRFRSARRLDLARVTPLSRRTSLS